MSNLERLKQRLEESLEKHKNRLLRTRHKKANGSVEAKAMKSTNKTGEEPNRIERAKKEMTHSGRVNRATVGRDKQPNRYDEDSLKGRLIERLRGAKVPPGRGKKESIAISGAPLRDKLHCKAVSLKCGRRGSGANHEVEGRAIEESTVERHTMERHTVERPTPEDCNFDGVSNEVRDNLNDLFRHFVNCKINNLYVIHGDRGKLPRGDFAEEGRGVMMIPGVGASEEVQEGVLGEVVGANSQLGGAFPDGEEVGCEKDARGGAKRGSTLVGGETKKGSTLVEVPAKKGSTLLRGEAPPSSESTGGDIEGGRYNSNFVKLMQIKKKIKKKIKAFEDEEKRLLCSDERTVCTLESSNEERNLPVRDLSTCTDGDVTSVRGVNHWGGVVVQVGSSVASAVSTNQEEDTSSSSTGESVELFTTQKNIFVCNYYAKKSRRRTGRRGERREGPPHVVSGAANFLGSAFSLASRSTAMCRLGECQVEEFPSGEFPSGEYPSGEYPSGEYQSDAYEAHFDPREYKREPQRRSSSRRIDTPGKTKYELSSCPSSYHSNRSNCLSPCRGSAPNCLRGPVGRGPSTQMGNHLNDGGSPAGERHAKWGTLERGREPQYARESRPLSPKRSATCLQKGRSQGEMKSGMQCEMNLRNRPFGEGKEGANRFPIWRWPRGGEVPWRGAGVRASPPVEWDKGGQFSGEFSGQRGGHYFGEPNGQLIRPGDDPRASPPPQLTRSAHQSCGEHTKCYICSFPIRKSEEQFILRKKKRDYHVGRMQKGEAYKEKECTPKNCLREPHLLYRRSRCEVSHLPQGVPNHGGVVPGDMLLTLKGGPNDERGRLLHCRETLHGGAGKWACMADQEGEEKKMESFKRRMEIKHRGGATHGSEDDRCGHATNLRCHSVREDHPPREASFVIDSGGPTCGGTSKGEEAEEAVWDGGGFSLQRSTQEGGLQRVLPTCAVRGDDEMKNKRRSSQWRNNPGRGTPQVPLPPGVAPPDVDHLSEAYNTWVYKERVCASAEREGVSMGSGVLSESTRGRKPKTRFWKISEGDTFNLPIEGEAINLNVMGEALNLPIEEDPGKVLQTGVVPGERPAERPPIFSREGGTNRRRATSNGAILKKVLRMKIEAMRREKGNMGGEAEPRKVTPPVGPAQAEQSAHNAPNGGRNRLSERGDGEGWVSGEMSRQMWGAARSRSGFSRGALSSDPPSRLPPSSRVEREGNVQMSPPVEACSVGSGPGDEEADEGEDVDEDGHDDGREALRFDESFYCNLKRMESDDVYPNSEEPISSSEKRRLLEAYLEDLRRKKRQNGERQKGEKQNGGRQNERLPNYSLKYNIEFFKFAQLICQDKSFCSSYLGQMGTNMVANGDDVDRIAFSIVKLFNAR
ncbi:conserved Plasmodium protein, unknown function [Plasmodium vivax]|uniref:Uncharacterized protein n=1 Tax=Plasmodium vivax TaxID=5855 RepID=A0A1G4H9I0_PLAVI|nr:conserved Plasmodium protein, unknown function [Plasmodium vivax]